MLVTWRLGSGPNARPGPPGRHRGVPARDRVVLNRVATGFAMLGGLTFRALMA
jgi:hypothetical protein